MREITYNQAVGEALQEEFRRDGKTVHLSTMVPADLLNEFGEARVREAPISESAIVGAAVGLAGSGFRPVIDIGLATFGFVAMDQIVSQAAKITYMFGGQACFPILYRMGVGAGFLMAAQHSISPYSMFMNVPGLKIILPATPYDAKGLLKSAVRENNPVIYFEHMAFRFRNLTGPVPEEEYTIPLGKADIKRAGTDVTVVALAWMLHEVLPVAEELASEGISVEVIDPRTLVPLDIETIRASVRNTGHLVVVDEACPTCGAAAEIISAVTEDADTFHRLKSPPQRVCGLEVPIPFSPPLEVYSLPTRERIISAIKQVMT
ncbi:alpha-ketoacid dehydrogenase subunit beta [Chloroflexota bacterium]